MEDVLNHRIRYIYYRNIWKLFIQLNLNSSNTDDSFTMANSNSFMSPKEILPIDQENKYLRKLSYFIMKLRGDSNEYTTYNYCIEDR